MPEILSLPKMAKLSSTSSSFPWSRHCLEGKVGLHRHFDLKDGEKPVELNNISTPWSVDEVPLPVGGEILPIDRLIQDGKFMPYEFYFAPLNGRPTFKSADLIDLSI